MRKSGILLPISSLPSPYGIGCFSKEAYEFVDRLREAGQSYWQILPLGPTSYGDSPYQSFSSFAGNPYFIDPLDLVKRGWLTKADCDAYDFGGSEEYVDYAKMYKSRFSMLRKAYANSHIEKDPAFVKYIEAEREWLVDYALYMAVKGHFGNTSWASWDEDIKLRKPQALATCREKFADEVRFYQFQQYLFDEEWTALKAYANQNGIKIVGDIPIYVAFDSSDAWANPELFQFDEKSTPTAVAGCPPDGFAATGQLWGNPLYDWEYHKKTKYAWWMKRLKGCFKRYDVLRIDHFRGFDEYYAIPYGHKTAEHGKWMPGPGYDFFRVMKEELGEREIIAEDLGFLTPSVIELVKKTGYPGMKILQFAFDSREESDYLPHNYTRNCVVYTGTHDNETTEGWYESLSAPDRVYCQKYLGLHGSKKATISREMIRQAMCCVADTAIIPMQDYLGLGDEARMNTPSTLGNNWKWRMKAGAFTDALAREIYGLANLYGRLPARDQKKA